MLSRRRTLALLLGAVALPGSLAGGALGASDGELRAVRTLDLRTAALAGQPAGPAGDGTAAAAARTQARAWRPPPASRDRSRALGKPNDGRLRQGVLLPTQGRDFLTFDPILERAPNREWRRYATGHLLRVVHAVLRDYRKANPDAPRVLIGDLSLPGGGEFGRRYGGLGHASHQNGLDIDLYYPRRDRRRAKAARVSQVDRRLAQELVDAFVARPEVRFAFVGLKVGLTGPPRRVQAIPHHDDHLHVRVHRPRT